ncbi:hypothetical protein Q8A67_025822 [Cirrhinus molitorella]|uniref:Uncharacterized protein n=1 Tax=Cirrhinus molitorella TaxID=172907 RepID=A0AA88TI65_9TELE|nr:hypothetical protein Q8A67_025822 [Cirrhinus molitorella]
MPVWVQEKHADSRKSKCSRADHEARSPTVTAKNIEHLWVMADRRRRRHNPLGMKSVRMRSCTIHMKLRPPAQREREWIWSQSEGFVPPALEAVG